MRFHAKRTTRRDERRRSRSPRSGSRRGSVPARSRAPSRRRRARSTRSRSRPASARCSGRAGMRKTPAGIEQNERTTGVTRPRKTAQSPQRSNQRSARSSRSAPEVEPAAVPLEAAAGRRRSPIPQPTSEPSEVADRARQARSPGRPRHRAERSRAEERHVLAGERSGGDRARRTPSRPRWRPGRRRRRAIRQKDRVEAVVADRSGDRARDRGDTIGETLRASDLRARFAGPRSGAP